MSKDTTTSREDGTSSLTWKVTWYIKVTTSRGDHIFSIYDVKKFLLGIKKLKLIVIDNLVWEIWHNKKGK